MILRYVCISRSRLQTASIARSPLYFQRDVFNNKSTLSRPLSLLVVAFLFRFCFFLFRLSLSLFFPLFPSFVPVVVAEKAFYSAVENALHSTQHSRSIIL